MIKIKARYLLHDWSGQGVTPPSGNPVKIAGVHRGQPTAPHEEAPVILTTATGMRIEIPADTDVGLHATGSTGVDRGSGA